MATKTSRSAIKQMVVDLLKKDGSPMSVASIGDKLGIDIVDLRPVIDKMYQDDELMKQSTGVYTLADQQDDGIPGPAIPLAELADKFRLPQGDGDAFMAALDGIAIPPKLDLGVVNDIQSTADFFINKMGAHSVGMFLAEHAKTLRAYL